MDYTVAYGTHTHSGVVYGEAEESNLNILHKKAWVWEKMKKKKKTENKIHASQQKFCAEKVCVKKALESGTNIVRRHLR